MASQIHAGLHGIERALKAPQSTDAPYAPDGDVCRRLRGALEEALFALEQDPILCAAFGEPFVAYFARVKRCELARYDAASDKIDFQRREYFSRF